MKFELIVLNVDDGVKYKICFFFLQAANFTWVISLVVKLYKLLLDTREEVQGSEVVKYVSDEDMMVG